MSQYSAEEKGFHGIIKAVIDVDENKTKLSRFGLKMLRPIQ